jgi:predicted anti-sigma-YlaC factor YlaD
MMPCGFVRRRLSAYLENDLGELAHRLVRRHLGRCRRCQRVFRSLVRTIDHVRELALSDPPVPSQADRIIDRLRLEAASGGGP